MRELSESTIQSIGYKARDEHAILGSLDLDGQNVRGACIEVARYVAGELSSRPYVDEDNIDRVKCQFKGHEMHYFVRIHGSEISGYEDEFVYVDASIDQFCDEQKDIGRVDVTVGSYDNLPRVAIIGSNDSRRSWYQDEIIGV